MERNRDCLFPPPQNETKYLSYLQDHPSQVWIQGSVMDTRNTPRKCKWNEVSSSLRFSRTSHPFQNHQGDWHPGFTFRSQTKCTTISGCFVTNKVNLSYFQGSELQDFGFRSGRENGSGGASILRS